MPSSTPKICGGVSLPTYGRSEPPATYSIAMYGTPSASRKSYSVTMFGCERAPTICPSSTKRWAIVESPLAISTRLSATSRSSAGCRARKTTAMPPRAMTRTIS